jgi:hypothetical protein
MPSLSSHNISPGQAVLPTLPSIIKAVMPNLPPNHICPGQTVLPAFAPNQIMHMFAPGKFLATSNNVQIRVVKPGEETDLYLTPNIIYGESSEDDA